jgi:hypothetical protein
MSDIVDRLRTLNADFLHEEAADEIERLRGLLEEWKEEPCGGIVKFGVVYLSPERVASIVDPLKAERDRLRERRNELMGALLAWLYANDVGDEQKRAEAVAYARSVVRDADT